MDTSVPRRPRYRWASHPRDLRAWPERCGHL